MKVIQQRINEIGRLIKKYKNKARAANQQRKWREERNWIEKIKALNSERKTLQGQGAQTRAAGQLSPRIIKRINVLLNEIKRDTRILEIHKSNNNRPGVQKYENILRAKKAKLAALQGRQSQPAEPTGVNNNRKIRVLLNEIRRDRQILARHQQAGNAAGVTKYEKIIREQLTKLQKLREQNQGQGSGGSTGSGQSGEPQTGSTGASSGSAQVSPEIRKIADDFKNSPRRDRDVDEASNKVIDLLLTTQFSELNAVKDQLFILKGGAVPPPEGSVIDQPFIRDVFKIFQSDTPLKNYTIKDTIIGSDFNTAFDKIITQINKLAGDAGKQLAPFKKLAHRDAFQLIPQEPDTISQSWSQFAGAKLSNITLENISIHSKGSLQGVFSSDGAFENVHFKNISVDTQSAHQIAILGMLSGTLDLTTALGDPVEVNLLPLRLGGGRNIYIQSFSSESSYQYRDIDTGTSNAIVKDNRQLQTKRGKYYRDFNMDNFIMLIKSEPKNNLSEFLDHIESSAERSGTLVT